MCFAAGRSYANITGADVQNFNPTYNGLGFVTVHSSETLAPGIFNLGLFGDYSVNTLPRYDDIEGRSSKTKDSLFGTEAHVGLGILKGWDIGVSIPQSLFQEVKVKADRTEFESKGITEARISSKIKLYGGRDGGIAFLLSSNINLTRNTPFNGQNSKPTINYELIINNTFGNFALGANIGYRDRSPGTPIPDYPIAPIGDQVVYSAAASYFLESITSKLILEYYAASAIDKTATIPSRSLEPSEVLIGFKHMSSDQLSWHAGLGTEINQGVSTPDWRVYAGLNYSFGFETQAVKNTRSKAVAVKPKKLKPVAPSLENKVKVFAVKDIGPKETSMGEDEIFVLRGVNFAFDSDNRVLLGTHVILLELAEHLRSNSYKKVIIEGHTDWDGPDAYNKKLGKDRSKAVLEHMVKFGMIERKRLEAISYGESKPVVPNDTADNRLLNRRVVFRIFK